MEVEILDARDTSGAYSLRYPPGVKAFGSRVELDELDDPLPEAHSADFTWNITILRGCTASFLRHQFLISQKLRKEKLAMQIARRSYLERCNSLEAEHIDPLGLDNGITRLPNAERAKVLAEKPYTQVIETTRKKAEEAKTAEKNTAAEEKKQKELFEQKPEVAMRSFVSHLIEEKLKAKGIKQEAADEDDVDMDLEEKDISDKTGCAPASTSRAGALNHQPRVPAAAVTPRTAPGRAPDSRTSASTPGNGRRRKASGVGGPGPALPKEKAEAEGPRHTRVLERKEEKDRGRETTGCAHERRPHACMAEFIHSTSPSQKHAVRLRLQGAAPSRYSMAGPVSADLLLSQTCVAFRCTSAPPGSTRIRAWLCEQVQVASCSPRVCCPPTASSSSSRIARAALQWRS